MATKLPVAAKSFLEKPKREKIENNFVGTINGQALHNTQYKTNNNTKMFYINVSVYRVHHECGSRETIV